MILLEIAIATVALNLAIASWAILTNWKVPA